MSLPAVADPQISQPTRKSIIFGWWPRTGKAEKYARHLAAIAFWAYLFLNTVVTDVDAQLAQVLPPNLGLLIQYKLFFFIGAAGLTAAFVSTPRVMAWAIYVLFYPLSRFALFTVYAVVTIVKAKSWPITFSALNLVLSFFKTFKINFVLFSVIAVSLAIVATSHNSSSLLCAAMMMAVLVVVIVVRRFASLFRPSQLLKTYVPVMAAMMKFTREQMTPTPVIEGEHPTETEAKQLDTWASNLQQAVILRVLSEYLSIKFSDYRKSGLPILYYLLNYVLLLVGIVFLFTMINEAVYGAHHDAFKVTGGHTLFDFLYYSFCTLVAHGTPDIAPISVLARSSEMFETIISAVLLGMFVAIYFAHKRTLDDSDVAEVIETLRRQATSMDDFVQAKCSLSLDAAIERLERLQKGVSVWLGILRAAQNSDDA